MIFHIVEKYSVFNDFGNSAYPKDPNDLAEFLNDNYLGYIYVKNPDEEMSIVLKVSEYKVNGGNISIIYEETCNKVFKVLNDSEIKVESFFKKEGRVGLHRLDVICLLSLEKQKPSRIRWYKKGKLGNFQTFEEYFHIDIDPYGEEDWDEEIRVGDKLYCKKDYIYHDINYLFKNGSVCYAREVHDNQVFVSNYKTYNDGGWFYFTKGPDYIYDYFYKKNDN